MDASSTISIATETVSIASTTRRRSSTTSMRLTVEDMRRLALEANDKSGLDTRTLAYAELRWDRGVMEAASTIKRDRLTAK